MDERFVCAQCLLEQESEQRCAECSGQEFVDATSKQARDQFVDELARRAVERRDKFYVLMKVFVILVSATVLFVGLSVTSALGGGALDWGVKLLALALLATTWRAIPQIYHRYLRGRASLLFEQWSRADASDGLDAHPTD